MIQEKIFRTEDVFQIAKSHYVLRQMNKMSLTQVYFTVDISELELKGKRTGLQGEKIICHM